MNVVHLSDKDYENVVIPLERVVFIVIIDLFVL